MFSEYIEKGIDILKGTMNIGDLKKHVLCDDCRKPTASACGCCKKYSKGYYVMQFYAQQLQMFEDHL
ncbi:4070_t:CDS:2 [Scutellospora calospora]|uniref:4070_t:CDS:1 n=1 Tax=Scutellospora calospora TaxID=85575 RepID=A0ACA9LKA9_9GLOM|nr:4070_t:CDS:2 [Scutellospora calospora]